MFVSFRYIIYYLPYQNYTYQKKKPTINICRFTVSGRVVGAVGGESCSLKNGGPSNVNIELLSPSGDPISSVLTSSTGSYSFTNIIPGWDFITFLSLVQCVLIRHAAFSSFDVFIH